MVLVVICENVCYEGNCYMICIVWFVEENLCLFLCDDVGVILGQFFLIEVNLFEGQIFSFGMNVGMYYLDCCFVGFYLEEGMQEFWFYLNLGSGNFGFVFNGVFCICSVCVDVIESFVY